MKQYLTLRETVVKRAIKDIKLDIEKTETNILLYIGYKMEAERYLISYLSCLGWLHQLLEEAEGMAQIASKGGGCGRTIESKDGYCSKW